MKPPPEFTFRRRLVLLRILQIHPQRFVDAQVVLRNVAEELALFVDEGLGGGQGVIVGVVVVLIILIVLLVLLVRKVIRRIKRKK